MRFFPPRFDSIFIELFFWESSKSLRLIFLALWASSRKWLEIDLFRSYVLSFHFRPRDATRGNSFFKMSSYARANVRISNEINKRKIPMRASHGLKWENKMYKQKRSIMLGSSRCLFSLLLPWLLFKLPVLCSSRPRWLSTFFFVVKRSCGEISDKISTSI